MSGPLVCVCGDVGQCVSQPLRILCDWVTLEVVVGERRVTLPHRLFVRVSVCLCAVALLNIASSSSYFVRSSVRQCSKNISTWTDSISVFQLFKLQKKNFVSLLHKPATLCPIERRLLWCITINTVRERKNKCYKIQESWI